MSEFTTSTGLTAADAPLWNSEAHHGPVVSVVTWMLLIACVLAVLARLVTRYITISTLHWDDILTIFAMVTAIGQSIAVSISSTNGLGSHAEALSAGQIDVIQKALYASTLMYMITLGLAKNSVCIHVYNLSPVPASRHSSTVLLGVITIWTISAVLVVAFQCKLPTPWAISSSGQCIDMFAFWTYYGVLNIITDLALIALPVSIVSSLRMKTSKKAIIIACYCPRLSASIAQILQLAYLHTTIFRTKTTDLIYDLWIPTLLGQCVITFSLISACLPFLKVLIDALETGMVRADGLNVNNTQFQLKSLNRSADGYYKAQGSQFQKGPLGSSSNDASAKPSAAATPKHGATASAPSAWGGKRDGSKKELGRQGLDDTSKNKETSKNKDSSKNKESERGGRGSQGLPNVHFESTAYRGSDLESQSSQTHIMRKVEWSVTEENSGAVV